MNTTVSSFYLFFFFYLISIKWIFIIVQYRWFTNGGKYFESHIPDKNLTIRLKLLNTNFPSAAVFELWSIKVVRKKVKFRAFFLSSTFHRQKLHFSKFGYRWVKTRKKTPFAKVLTKIVKKRQKFCIIANTFSCNKVYIASSDLLSVSYELILYKIASRNSNRLSRTQSGPIVSFIVATINITQIRNFCFRIVIDPNELYIKEREWNQTLFQTMFEIKQEVLWQRKGSFNLQ